MSRQDIDSYRERVTRGPNWKKIVAIIFSLLLAVVAAGSFAIYFYGHSLISLANFVSDEDVMQVETLPEAAYEETEAILEGTVVNESELDNIHLQMSKTGSLDTILNKDVYNIVLAGVDRRDKSWNGNADSVMLVSINAEKKAGQYYFSDARYLCQCGRSRLHETECVLCLWSRTAAGEDH